MPDWRDERAGGCAAAGHQGCGECAGDSRHLSLAVRRLGARCEDRPGHARARDGVGFSTAYFDRQPDGSFSQPRGRWPDWLFPPGSFGDEPGTLDGTPVLAMSVADMLAMKEQFPHLRNGRPWRQKDIDDIKILRGLAAEADAQP
jgi:hypothetical protein